MKKMRSGWAVAINILVYSITVYLVLALSYFGAIYFPVLAGGYLSQLIGSPDSSWPEYLIAGVHFFLTSTTIGFSLWHLREARERRWSIRRSDVVAVVLLSIGFLPLFRFALLVFPLFVLLVFFVWQLRFARIRETKIRLKVVLVSFVISVLACWKIYPYFVEIR